MARFVKVIVREAGRKGKDVHLWRDFAGHSVEGAIEALHSQDISRGGLRGDMITIGPYYLNEKEIRLNDQTILKPGDELSCNDP